MTARQGSIWTDEKVEELKRLWADGKSASEIAAALGPAFTRNGVIGKVHRLGLAGRGKPSAYYRAPAPRKVETDFRTSAAAAMERRINAGKAADFRTSNPGNIARRAVRLVQQIAAAPPAVAAENAARAVELRCENVTWDGLGPDSCRWITTTSTKADAVRFCGAPRSPLERLPYCACHAGLSYDRKAA
jgi:GcrA cell cycle regulator